MPSIITGVDIGGTFTDLIYVDESSGAAGVSKVMSTPDDPSRALVQALRESRLRLDDLLVIVHGTTVATNTVLQRRGAVCGLLTTKGFRDILEFRRRDRPHTFGLTGLYEPLVPRDRCLEVDERVDFAGEVLTPLKEEDVRSAARQLLAQGVQAVVVSFLHSYANPAHERRAREILEELWPNDHIVLSSEVLPEYREFERTSTAVVNAYVQPCIGDYLRSLLAQLRGEGYRRDVVLIQSNGGIMSLDVARRASVNTLLSGPAAGVMAAVYLSSAAGFPNAISCDMGGTSFDVCLIADGKPSMKSTMELEYAVPINVPMIDITSIGAGGGSIAWLDGGGILQIGPQSAGADPGPVCYKRGGEEPTVTDANLLLGRINPQYSIASGEGFSLDVEIARAVLAEKIGKPLGLSPTEAADAVLQVANNKMAGSIRMVSIERGLDPRDFTLVAFGGAGPLHAAAIMRELGLARAIIPLFPGVTSAMGCIMANVRHDFVQTINQRLDQLDFARLRTVYAEHERRGRQLIAEEGIPVAAVEVLYEADMAYEGQTHVVKTVFPRSDVDEAAIRGAFEETYRRFYGRTIEGFPIVIVSLRTTVEGVRPSLDLRGLAPQTAASLEEARKGVRQVSFQGVYQPTPIYERHRLPIGAKLRGPAVLEQPDSTTVIPPWAMGRVDDLGNLILEVQP